MVMLQKNPWLALFVGALALSWHAPARAADLGKALSGESCRTQEAFVPGKSDPVLCGAEPIGQIAAFPASTQPQARHQALAQILQGSGDHLDCPQQTWLKSGRAVLGACTIKSSGWSRIVLGVDDGSRLLRAEGPPSSLPVLEAAVAVASESALSDQERADLDRALEAQFSPAVLHAPSSGFSRYTQLIEEARLAGASHDFARAEADYRQALAIEEPLYGRESVVVGMALAELALQVSNQRKFGEAGALFRRAAAIIDPSTDADARARLDSYRALDAANRHDYAGALSFARLATAARRAQLASAVQTAAPRNDAAPPPTPRRGELAHALRIEAEMALRVDDLSGASAAADEALWIVNEEPGLPMWWRADMIALQGELNERRGRYFAAESDFRDARNLDAKLFGDSAPTAFAALRLAEFYVREQVYPPALEAFRAAFDIAARDAVARSEIAPDDIIAFATAAAEGRQSRDADIFRATQLMHSGAADRTIAQVAARRAADDPALSEAIAKLQTAERSRDRARIELAAEIAKTDDERSAARQHDLEVSLQRESDAADALRSGIAQGFPRYAQLADAGAADLAAVRAQLKPGEALISFVLGKDGSYAFVVRHDGFAAVPVPLDAENASADVAELRRAFAPVSGHLPPFDLKKSYALYHALLAPLESHLDGIDRLVVVPGQILASLPLAVLVTAPPHDDDDRNAAWLVRRFAVSEVPSPRAFLLLREAAAQASPAQKPFLGFAAPSFTGHAGAKALETLTAACRQGPVAPDVLRALPPLPDTAREVETIGARLGGSQAVVVLGAQATEANLRALPLREFKVLYFATHGILPGELQCQAEPALALSPPARPASDPNEDGMLEASEIAQFDLNADLVVLSACNTAQSGDGLGGGSLEGLSDSFFAAGAHAVLASHWEVPSAATVSLMTGVFGTRGPVVDIAGTLRRSQLALIAQRDLAHPFYWGAFTLIGDSASAPARSARLDEGDRR